MSEPSGTGESLVWTHYITGGPWPERRGLRCRVVDDPGNGTYPWDKPSKHNAVVLVENDPHDGKVYSFGPGLTDEQRGWTCVLGYEHLTRFGAQEATDGD